MVCLGVLFGCKRSRSVKDYVLTALVVVAILSGFRILCYIFLRLRKRPGGHEMSLNDGSEMQTENASHGNRFWLRTGLP
ncbi:hypothetical protein V6N13_144249 [Hibiscus sabdariffa]|uniref:Uncharacterized protein n=1 Tax=Hibiscus sabdariffa TaxID=183260 RepID=A0ABR2FK11_9ROSI